MMIRFSLANSVIKFEVSILWPSILLIFLSEAFARQISPMQIEHIDIIRQNVFDQKEANQNFFYNFVNSLHPLTKERVIRNELLFYKGDTLDASLLEESERNLRRLEFIGDARITIDTLDNEQVRVRVNTEDCWTMGVQSGFKQEGGITSMYLGLKDGNFRGAGQKLTMSYQYRSDMHNPHGIQFFFREPHLFNTNWRTILQYKNSEDLRIQTILIDRLFIHDQFEWAASFYTDFGKALIKEYENGKIMQQYQLSRANQEIWFSRSMGKNLKFRYTCGYYRNRTTSPNIDNRSFENIDLISLAINLMKRTYYKDQFLNNIGRIEDIPVGFLLNLNIGKNLRIFRENPNEFFYRADWLHAMKVRSSYYLSYILSASSYLQGNIANDFSLRFTLLQNFKLPLKQTLLVRLSGVRGFRWSQGQQLILGSNTGLRGYSAYEFSGQRQLLINLEDRIFPNVNFWLFHIGGAFFFDSGMVWKEEQLFHRQRFHSSVGLGLRIANKKQSGDGLLRIDLAFNLDKNRFTEIIISTGQLISAFSNIDFIAPGHLLK